MEKQNEANGTASEPIARYDELPILRTYKVAFEAMRYDIQTGKVMGYTHADRIRSMTDEELAWELCRIVRMPFYKDDSEIDAYEVDCWAKWLKQEAET